VCHNALFLCVESGLRVGEGEGNR